MIFRFFLRLFAFWSVLPGVSAALATPGADVIGKSVVVRWTEARQQRINNSPDVKAVTIGFEMKIYISGTGRPFNRLTTTSPGGTDKHEQVGVQGKSLGGGVRSITANGNSIVLQANYGNYARILRVEVSPGAASCNATMSVGKEAGSAPKAFQVSGRTIEIHSLSVSGITCSVRQGNVFGS